MILGLGSEKDASRRRGMAYEGCIVAGWDHWDDMYEPTAEDVAFVMISMAFPIEAALCISLETAWPSEGRLKILRGVEPYVQALYQEGPPTTPAITSSLAPTSSNQQSGMV